MKPKIEDIKVDMDLLNAELRVASYKQKYQIMKKHTGGPCLCCGDIPTKKISYDVGGAKLIEFYCDNCFNNTIRRNEGRHKKDIDRF